MKRSAPVVCLGLAWLAVSCGGKAASGPDAARHSEASFEIAHAPISASDLAEVQSHLAAREYWASETERGLQAPNRQNDFRTLFAGQGIRVEDRDGAAPTELVELALARIGRGDRWMTVPEGEVTNSAQRVEIARSALGLVEWFVNGEDGLEQGFTLARPPDTASAAAMVDGEVGNRAPLVLDLTVRRAEARLFGDAVALETNAGRFLSYGQLVVSDAEGEALAAHFEVPESDRIRLVVDDREAKYPITIDPLLTSSFDARIESNSASAGFGIVASAGDVNGDGYDDIIVGTSVLFPSAPLPVYIFHGGPNGIATGAATAANTILTGRGTGDAFGASVASAGDVNGDGFDDVIVGATHTSSSAAGEAFIFLGSATGVASGSYLSAATTLTASGDASFGTGVASAGDINGDGYHDVIVSATGFDAPEVNEGAAFIYLGSATGVPSGSPATAHARFESNQPEAQWGRSVASAGDVNGDGFGDVIIGATLYDNGTTNEGAAFVFLGSATGFVNGSPSTAATTLESNQASLATPSFGVSVSSAGDVDGDGYSDVIVGAPAYDNGLEGEGAAFIFKGSATGVPNGNPSTASAILDSDQNAGPGIAPTPRFGARVASAGDVNGDGHGDVVVSASGYDNGQIDEGAAFVFLGSVAGVSSGNPTTAYRSLELNVASGFFATTVASAGDVDRDGFDDVVVGSVAFSSGESFEGAAFVYRGGGAGVTNATAASGQARLESGHFNSGMGYSVASAGDVNADGYTDVIVGAFLYDDGDTDEGAAFIFHGTATGIANGDVTTANAKITSNQPGAQLGRKVASAGDVNGDGFGDVIVGAYLYDNPETDEGAAFVFLGSASGIVGSTPATAHARIESNEPSAGLGFALASAGDVNGDGFADVIIGSPGSDNGTIDEGAAFLFHGSASGIANSSPATAAATFDSNQAPSGPLTAGWAVSVGSAGDVNADGFGDVVIGASAFTNGQVSEGGAFVFLGSPSGVASGNPSTAHARIESNQTNARLGLSVGGAGDVNGDGFGDLIVAGSGFSTLAGAANAPVAYLFHGSIAGIASGTPSTANSQLAINSSAVVPPAVVDAVFVAGAGDVNGDGYADVIVGYQPIAVTSPFNGVGAAAVHLGSATGIPSGTPATAHARIQQIPGFASAQNLVQDLVASAGDVNGDGFADVWIGGPAINNGFMSDGAVFLHLGNFAGRPVLARQRRGDGSGIAVQPGGAAFANGSFVVEVLARSASGRERAKVEIETCPVGSPFGAPACVRQTSPSWIDLGTSGAVISQTVAGLSTNTAYSWRTRIHTIPLRSTQPGIVPIVEASPWFRQQARATPGDIRTVPEPTLATSFAFGTAPLLMGALRIRRQRARFSSRP